MVVPQFERLMSKIPPHWQSVFTLMSQGVRHHKLAHAWYRRSQCETKSSWDDLLKALCVVEPVLVRECLMFQPLLACLQEDVAAGFLDFLHHHQDSISPDSLERFVNTVAHHFQTSHQAFSALQNIAETLPCRGIMLPSCLTLDSNRLVERPDVQADLNNVNGLPNVDSNGFLREQTLVSNTHNIRGNSQSVTHETEVNVDVCLHSKGLCDATGNTASITSADNVDVSVICIEDDEAEEKNEVAHEQCDSRNEETNATTDYPCDIETEQCTASGQVSASGSAVDSMKSQLQRVKEAWVAGEKETSPDLDILASVPPSQMSTACGMLGLTDMEETSLSTVADHLASIADKLSSASSMSLLSSIVEDRFAALATTPSRQFTACLASLSAAFPRQLVGVVSDCLSNSQSCTAGQAETLVSLCRSLDVKTLAYFLGELCQSGVPVDDNMVSVAQCIVDLHPELNPTVIMSTLAWLETFARQQAGSAKYGRLVLSFIKVYRTQFNPSHTASLRVIVDAHKSFTRRSLQQAMKNLLP
ncbi:hypothetical protein BaRGS_00019934 [Batillaria attramentaria]|uniref:Fanconi Anaemia group E protein C-terminal domain-containing protein n=1 Tax=Batillaria attramentaria TaxID=370345 RepID=A0ABD0KP14_9CAEN